MMVCLERMPAIHIEVMQRTMPIVETQKCHAMGPGEGRRTERRHGFD
jgi:hypothetical protein